MSFFRYGFYISNFLYFIYFVYLYHVDFYNLILNIDIFILIYYFCVIYLISGGKIIVFLGDMCYNIFKIRERLRFYG